MDIDAAAILTSAAVAHHRQSRRAPTRSNTTALINLAAGAGGRRQAARSLGVVASSCVGPNRNAEALFGRRADRGPRPRLVAESARREADLGRSAASRRGCRRCRSAGIGAGTGDRAHVAAPAARFAAACEPRLRGGRSARADRGAVAAADRAALPQQPRKPVRWRRSRTANAIWRASMCRSANSSRRRRSATGSGCDDEHRLVHLAVRTQGLFVAASNPSASRRWPTWRARTCASSTARRGRGNADAHRVAAQPARHRMQRRRRLGLGRVHARRGGRVHRQRHGRCRRRGADRRAALRAHVHCCWRERYFFALRDTASSGRR